MMAKAKAVQRGNAAGWPVVAGTCPACGWRALFLGSGGYVTCSMLDCPDPCAPSKVLGAIEADVPLPEEPATVKGVPDE